MEKIEYQKEGILFNLRYEHSDCSFEILVNDIPIATHYGLGERSGLTVAINQYIQKSGVQNITIRMSPAKTEENEFATTLAKDSFVKVLITKNKEPMSILDQINAKEKGEIFKTELINYQTPMQLKSVAQEDYKINFEVKPQDINWTFVGWSTSKDLTNEPNIRQEVDAFYADYQKTLEDGNQSKYQALLQNSIFEEAASIPWNKQALNQLTTNMTGYATDKRSFIYRCKNAELKFYGNGRVVTLVCTDTISFGYSPLISKTAKNMMPKAHTFYLHKRQGSGKLEIIR